MQFRSWIQNFFLQNEKCSYWNWWFANLSLQGWRLWNICMYPIYSNCVISSKVKTAQFAKWEIKIEIDDLQIFLCRGEGYEPFATSSNIQRIKSFSISVADRLPPPPHQPCPLWALALGLRDTRWRNCIRKVRIYPPSYKYRKKLLFLIIRYYLYRGSKKILIKQKHNPNWVLWG